jgi:predicted permease
MAVRRALGAGRSRHIRQVLTETLVLMLLGGASGIVLARLGLSIFVSAGIDVLPRIRDIRLDGNVLMFAGILTLLAGLAAGAAPALAASDLTLGETLKGSGRGRRRTRARAVLVVMEVAVSVVLLIGAGLLLKGFLRVVPSAPGYAPDHRITLSVSLGDVPGGSPDSATAHLTFVAAVAGGMATVPGVRDVAATSFLPLILASAMYPVEPEGSGGARAKRPGHQRSVTPNYFQLMKIPLIAGREFMDTDDSAGAAVTVVNEAAARRWWPGESPIGKHLTWTRAGAARTTAEVVGVARNVRFYGTDTSHVTEFYVPYAQVPYRFVNFVVWTTGDPRTLTQQLKQKIWAVSPRLPIDNVATLDEIIGDSVKEERLYVVLIGAFATIAMVLAAAGIFSVLAYAVAQRTREIGIRMALGAPRVNVGGLVIRQGAIIAALGLGIGVIAARLLTRFLQSLLLVVSPTDTGVFIATIFGLLLVALAACLLPLRRALTVDPVKSLRAE